MEGSNSPRGLILDLITPFEKGGGIDGRGLGRQLDRVMPHVQALLLAGPRAGEGRNLHAAQREELLEKVLVVVRGRLPLLVWITGDREEETSRTLLLLEKRIETRRYGGPVFWVDSPLYYHSNRGLADHYRKLFSLTGRPLLLHNDPELIRGLARPLKRNSIRTSILKELLSLEEIRGLIFLGSLDRANHYQKAARSRTDFRIYDGDESRFLFHPSLSGVVSAGANLAPGAWSRITAASLNPRIAETAYPDHLQQIWETGTYLRNLLESYGDAVTPVIKGVLSIMGIIGDPATNLEGELPKEAIETARLLMAEYGDFPGEQG